MGNPHPFPTPPIKKQIQILLTPSLTNLLQWMKCWISGSAKSSFSQISSQILKGTSNYKWFTAWWHNYMCVLVQHFHILIFCGFVEYWNPLAGKQITCTCGHLITNIFITSILWAAQAQKVYSYCLLWSGIMVRNFMGFVKNNKMTRNNQEHHNELITGSIMIHKNIIPFWYFCPLESEATWHLNKTFCGCILAFSGR